MSAIIQSFGSFQMLLGIRKSESLLLPYAESNFPRISSNADLSWMPYELVSISTPIPLIQQTPVLGESFTTYASKLEWGFGTLVSL